MKTAKSLVLRSCALAVAFGVSLPVFADVSATVSGSNMYLWRGQAISGAAPQISGSLDYKHASGAFAGVWGSSEGPFDSSNETDIYAGYSGKAGDFTYGLTLWQYYYAQNSGSLHYTNTAAAFSPGETQLSAGYGPLAFSVLVDTNDSANQYYTLTYTYDKFSALVGTWKKDLAPGEVGEYTHLDLGYQATPELKFAVSAVIDPAKADPAKDETLVGIQNNGNPDLAFTKQDSDPLFYVAYSKTFDL